MHSIFLATNYGRSRVISVSFFLQPFPLISNEISISLTRFLVCKSYIPVAGTLIYHDTLLTTPYAYFCRKNLSEIGGEKGV